ncbi:non-hydrolyzing UDP-N-acetylglucosamine 2-epimerase [Methylobacterium brachythecii]|uniref:UDP-N-acetylglucosamine 2-epimerase (non-hydrolyzing) n=1 Tax=Methylobacterium brachythecii TaxID=1176177 RepID=A0A7W6F689_9HYPH|nr:UDP-N-acetylglucosamine 2-epimerase (non-hydrolyzing) [Methylobacterium brachythecii]MBB3902120.1 UDP-N-acetylglucosamine 2-epimerase (non-hydrolyzing) [Methylobacterium brachythecii]GLS44517.1 UDP-N-acetylglucosamine 2-epimerase [Methylobacterium brachythecii]
MKVLTVFGTRPEAIKMAPVVAALRESASVSVRVCVTGQHRSMLDSVLRTFAIVPDDDLDVMSPDQSLSEVFARILARLDPILATWKPDFVLVQGDTVTSTAAALAAFYRRVRVGHVEAGLRTGDMNSPWPEEANRRLTAVVTDRHYAPTERARRALLAEGYPEDAIRVTGNTVIDALLRCTEANARDPALQSRLQMDFDWIDPHKRLILVTGHRRESFGGGFDNICKALATLARRPDVQIVYPVHLNPNVRGPVFGQLGNNESIRLIEPLDYPEFVALMSRADLILTDSGGIQEEAPALRKPVLVMRDTSERPEAIDVGVARLVGTDPAAIVAGVTDLLDDAGRYAAMANGATPYGDGRASARIVADLLECGSS